MYPSFLSAGVLEIVFPDIYFSFSTLSKSSCFLSAYKFSAKKFVDILIKSQRTSVADTGTPLKGRLLPRCREPFIQVKPVLKQPTFNNGGGGAIMTQLGHPHRGH